MNKRTFSLSWLAAAGGALALLGGCASPGGSAPVAAAPEAPLTLSASDFPPPDSAKWKQGAFPRRDSLRTMGPGMGKDQVREQLGWPHFSEGLGGARAWNYIFHLRTGQGSAFVTCQYQVRFDDQAKTLGTYWSSPACEQEAARTL